MKKILVLSDTHLTKNSQLPKEVQNYMGKVDFIIHAGDFNNYEFYQTLNTFKPVIGVCGNNDDMKLVHYLPLRRVVEIEKVKVGIFHGYGIKTTTAQRSLDEFKDDDVNLIIFGHSHKPFLEKINDRTLFNPGSPTHKRFQPRYSFGLLIINESEFQLEHIYFDVKIK